MVVLKTTLLLACLAVSYSNTNSVHAPNHPLQDSTETTAPAALVADAPAAKDVQGIHLLLDNDLDTTTPKNPVILLSKPRNWKDFEALCSALGEKLAPWDTPGLQKLLDTTPVAADEVKRVNLYWVSNPNGNSKCTAFDRKSGRTYQLSCSTKLPALCTNSLPRTQVGVTMDKSKQIKVITPKAGTWQGYRDRNQFRFLGIPYAEPPLGKLRFQAPQRLNPRKYGGKKVNDATNYGFVCTQLPFNGSPASSPEETKATLGNYESEDCLFLNVFTPALKANRARGLPVMVYVHGGSYTSFASSSPIFEPGNVVSRAGVVVVNLNYRLSTFGQFENTPEIPRSKAPGNLSTRDHIAALQWIRDNIVAFGGDPNQVTIFGESAGAWSMRALLSAPSAFGLYKNVIAQSDLIGLPFSSPKYSSDLSKLVMQNLGCKSSDIACARNVTANELVTAQLKAMDTFIKKPENNWVLPAAIFRPTVDKSLIPGDFAELLRTGKYNKKANIMWGYTKDEGHLFVPAALPDPVPLANLDKDLERLIPNPRTRILIKSPYYEINNMTDSVRRAFGDGMTDYYWACPIQNMGRAAAEKGSNLYTFRFDTGISPSDPFGIPPTRLCRNRVCHADDIVPTFGTGDIANNPQAGEEARLSRQVIDRFTTFAKTGNPNPSKKAANLGPASWNSDVTDVQWPKYDKTNPVFALSAFNSTVIRNGDAKICGWLSKNTQYDFQVHGPSGKFVPLFK
ncbi:hypothetical protein EC991_001463 [Linnemannia zychae]|nr:hypothetical protein EC991_001463 [Linnemannia zychae]